MSAPRSSARSYSVQRPLDTRGASRRPAPGWRARPRPADCSATASSSASRASSSSSHVGEDDAERARAGGTTRRVLLEDVFEQVGGLFVVAHFGQGPGAQAGPLDPVVAGEELFVQRLEAFERLAGLAFFEQAIGLLQQVVDFFGIHGQPIHGAVGGRGTECRRRPTAVTTMHCDHNRAAVNGHFRSRYAGCVRARLGG
jgi:hypothetical protein